MLASSEELVGRDSATAPFVPPESRWTGVESHVTVSRHSPKTTKSARAESLKRLNRVNKVKANLKGAVTAQGELGNNGAQAWR